MLDKPVQPGYKDFWKSMYSTLIYQVLSMSPCAVRSSLNFYLTQLESWTTSHVIQGIPGFTARYKLSYVVNAMCKMPRTCNCFTYRFMQRTVVYAVYTEKETVRNMQTPPKQVIHKWAEKTFYNGTMMIMDQWHWLLTHIIFELHVHLYPQILNIWPTMCDIYLYRKFKLDTHVNERRTANLKTPVRIVQHSSFCSSTKAIPTFPHPFIEVISIGQIELIQYIQ